MRQGREEKGGMGSALEGRSEGEAADRDGRGMWGQLKVKWRRVLHSTAFLYYVYPIVCPCVKCLFPSPQPTSESQAVLLACFFLLLERVKTSNNH